MNNSKKIVMSILITTIVIISMESAYAFTMTLDHGLGCGSRNWGIKEYQNDYSGIAVDFGRTHSCTTDFTFHGRSNVAIIENEINDNYPSQHISWVAIFQGEDPFGNKDNQNGHAKYHNTIFPKSATYDYNIKVQWLWTNDKKPEYSFSNIYANYLFDLWLEETSGNNVVVIDLLVDRLKNNNGNWAQDSVGNVGTTYYPPFCKVDDRGTRSTHDDLEVYHYGIIVDSNDSRVKDVWHEITVDISRYISDAFRVSYVQNDCNSRYPGSVNSYVIENQEQGIELQNFRYGDEGAVKGAYSWSELWY